MREFHRPKSGYRESEYEDAYSLDAEGGKFAVADGATESSFSNIWAKALVSTFVENPPPMDMNDRQSVKNLLDAARKKWYREIDWTSLPWFQKNKAVLGSYSTFLGLQVDSPESPKRYRVLYDEASYENMFSNRKSMSYLDRWGVVSDMYAFLVSGKLSFEKYANYISKFNEDQDNTVVQEMSSQYQQLYLLDHKNKKLVDIAIKFYKTQLERLGTMKKGESVNDTILRGTLSARLAMIDPGFAAEVAKKFDSMENEVPDMRGAIAIAAALHFSDVRKMADKLSKVKSDEDRVKIISAMGHIKGEESYNLVTKLIDEGKIKKQDITSYFSSLGVDPVNRDLAFKKLPEIAKRMSSVFVGTATPSRLIFGVTPYIGLGRTKEMEDLLKRISTPLLERGIAQGLESLAINEKLLKAIKSSS